MYLSKSIDLYAVGASKDNIENGWRYWAWIPEEIYATYDEARSDAIKM